MIGDVSALKEQNRNYFAGRHEQFSESYNDTPLTKWRVTAGAWEGVGSNQ